VLGLPYAVGDRIAKMIPEQAPPATFKQAMANGSELKAAYDKDEPTRQVVDLAMALEGLIRNDSIHAAGVVISDLPLTEYIPCSRRATPRSSPSSAWDDVAALGLLKMDFLGLRNLDVIEAALKLIETSQNVCIDMTRCRSTTPRHTRCSPRRFDRRLSVREQRHEGGAARGRAQRVRRPGRHRRALPPGSDAVHLDLRSQQEDPASVVYDHEALRPILEPTHGVTIYQEQ